MVLQVDFEDFADTVKRVIGDTCEAYAASEAGTTLLTASGTGEGAIVVAVTKKSLDEAKADLQTAGIRVFNGRWTDDVALEKETSNLMDMFIAGIAYKTEGGPPGVWVDAYPAQPTQVQVLKSMYDEMQATGEMADVSFEEFVRMSDANVVVVSPTQLRAFVNQKAIEESK